MQLEGMGRLGPDQLAWVKKDTAGSEEHPCSCVCSHSAMDCVPGVELGTQDSAELLSLLKSFGSVTVLNGHIHQNLQKVEGNVTFHTAMSTAFPQPKPAKHRRPAR